jgi:hypothetical protein
VEYRGSSGNDVIDQVKLNIPDGSVMFGEAGDDLITIAGAIAIGGAGNDTITGTGPGSTVAYWDSPHGVVVDQRSGTAQDGYGTTDTLVNIRTFQGSPFDDVFIGSAADEWFYGGRGNNAYTGNGGSDTVNYYFQPSTAATITYNAAADTFTVVKNFSDGDHGTDTLAGIRNILFSGDGSDGVTISKSSFVGDFRNAGKPVDIGMPDSAFVGQFKVGDFNGDGVSDFAAGGQVGTGTTAAPTILFVGDGKGGFIDATASVFAAGAVSTSTGGGRSLVADFNNDGISDLFQFNFGNDAPPFPGGQNGLYLSSPLDGKLVDATATLAQELHLNHAGSAGDVNGDGYADILVNTLDKGNFLLINDKTGHFVSRPELLPHHDTLETNTYSGIVDVNGDGFADLILGQWDAGGGAPVSQVLLNDGAGNFTKIAPIPLPDSGVDREIVVDVKAIDLNGDAFPDLMLDITNGGSNALFYRTPYIQLLVNDGSGHFTDESAARLPQAKAGNSGWFMELTAVDLNHDGHPDILASSAGGAVESTIFLNKGDGTFSVGWQAPPGGRAIAIDADADGMTDILTTTDGGIVTTYANKLANGHIYTANVGGDSLKGSGANDLFQTSPGHDVVDGGAGLDTVFIGAVSAASSVTHTASGFQVTGSGNTAVLTNVERIQFSDTAYALDVSGNGGQAYRIYQAAFNRTPDAAGLGYWISLLDKGASLDEIASGFVGSQEFNDAYGADPSNHDLLNRIYENVLHRQPDATGFDYWLNVLDTHAASAAQVLAGISESPENQAALIGVIGNGFAYLQFAG